MWQGVVLVVELSEPIQAAVSTLHSIESKAGKALAKSGEDGQPTGDRKDQLLSFLQLVRWLQLYIVGDAENAEPELAEELSEIYKFVFSKGKVQLLHESHFKISVANTAWKESFPSLGFETLHGSKKLQKQMNEEANFSWTVWFTRSIEHF